MISHSAEETIEFAKQYGKTLRGGDVVLLRGEMGAGKTVFVKGIAQALGIDEEITSPTYAYMNDYGGKLYHYDCYRLQNGAQALKALLPCFRRLVFLQADQPPVSEAGPDVERKKLDSRQINPSQKAPGSRNRPARRFRCDSQPFKAAKFFLFAL